MQSNNSQSFQINFFCTLSSVNSVHKTFKLLKMFFMLAKFKTNLL